MSPAIGRGLKRNFSQKAGAASARLFLFALLALLLALAYASYSAFTVYQQLDGGRRELAAAQARLSLTGQVRTPGSPQTAATSLRQAEIEFEAARRRSRDDLAFRLAATVPAGAWQVDATARLGAIGADISRAGQSAAAIAVQLDSLKRKYAGGALTPADLAGALRQAEAIATDYANSSRSITAQLRAAHAERTAVNTDGLLPPLRDAYAEVDAQLSQADSALSRYQDVRQMLVDLLGLALP